ncbi:phage protein NinX family protein [Burkholderia contaminans]|uniref:DUF2591 domain-containing protein n=1 Tax=Burkholderia contaminans TaxID=488447 RepID=A0A3N8R308_9BURK|nr:phage protein NinX family protein [Burkholderia contaminans]RQT26126.1 DUF2591 domain-containing protein [Burkholderia contaminans]
MKREFQTQDLTGAELDYFVAVAAGITHEKPLGEMRPGRTMIREEGSDGDGPITYFRAFQPSSNPTDGHPLIQDERINLNAPGPMGYPDQKKLWCAFIDTGSFGGSKAWFGATALEAACRAYVALKLGETVVYESEGR